MSTHARLRWGAAALVVLAIVLLSGSHLCEVALDKAAADPGMRPIGAGGLACTEFWLNRYQALIGAVTAVCAAAFAWRGVTMQVASSERQVAIGRRQSAIALIDVLNRQTSDVEALAKWVENTCHAGKSVIRYRIIAAKAIKYMLAKIEYPVELSAIYNSSFDTANKAHSSELKRLLDCIAKTQEFLAKSLISTVTKLDIEEFLGLARGLVTTEALLEDEFARVVNIFDMTQNLRGEFIDGIAVYVGAHPIDIDLFEHPGFISARVAATQLSKLLDNALREAEGR